MNNPIKCCVRENVLPEEIEVLGIRWNAEELKESVRGTLSCLKSGHERPIQTKGRACTFLLAADDAVRGIISPKDRKMVNAIYCRLYGGSSSCSAAI